MNAVTPEKSHEAIKTFVMNYKQSPKQNVDVQRFLHSLHAVLNDANGPDYDAAFYYQQLPDAAYSKCPDISDNMEKILFDVMIDNVDVKGCEYKPAPSISQIESDGLFGKLGSFLKGIIA